MYFRCDNVDCSYKCIICLLLDTAGVPNFFMYNIRLNLFAYHSVPTFFRFFNSIPKNPYTRVHAMDIGTVKQEVSKLYVTGEPVTKIDNQE